jgi:hypothetical protein
MPKKQHRASDEGHGRLSPTLSPFDDEAYETAFGGYLNGDVGSASARKLPVRRRPFERLRDEQAVMPLALGLYRLQQASSARAVAARLVGVEDPCTGLTVEGPTAGTRFPV